MNSIYNYLIGLTLDLNTTLVLFNKTATQLTTLEETTTKLESQITVINNITSSLQTQLTEITTMQNNINSTLESTLAQLDDIKLEIDVIQNYTSTLTELSTFVYNTDFSSGINTVITNNYMLTSLSHILGMDYDNNYKLISLKIDTMLSKAIDNRPNPYYTNLTVDNLTVRNTLDITGGTLIGYDVQNIIGNMPSLRLTNLTVLDSMKANNVELTSLTLLTDVINYTSDNTVIM